MKDSKSKGPMAGIGAILWQSGQSSGQLLASQSDILCQKRKGVMRAIDVWTCVSNW